VSVIVSRTGKGPERFPDSGDRPDTLGPGVAAALRTLLRAAEDAANIGTWEWDLETDELRWSDNLFRIYGLEPGAIRPSLGYGYLFEQLHPGDRERVERAGEAIRKEGQLQPLEYRFIRPDGAMRNLRATQALVEHTSSHPRQILGTVQDITERRRAEREIATHIAISESLVNWRTLEQGSEGLLQSVAEVLQCATSVMWIPQGDVLVARVVRRSDAKDGVEAIESVIRQLRLPRGIGLAGRAWERAEPIAVSNLEDNPRFGHGVVDDMSGAVAVPAMHAEQVLAVLEFFLCEPADVSDRFRRSLSGIGHELGRFLAHRGGELKPSTLTPREVEVLQLAANGRSGNEIAAALTVTSATVKTHFERIYLKYGASNRASAVAKALREGLID
jgi:PAS domain S-box-containing protein